MKTMYYISFHSLSGIIEVWCDMKALLSLQEACLRLGWKIITRRVLTRHYMVGPVNASGVFRTAYCR